MSRCVCYNCFERTNFLLIFCSAPGLDKAIAANRVHNTVVVVEDKIIDRTLVCLKRVSDLSALHIDELDISIAAADCNLLACLVKLTAMSDRITSVKVDNFLHHPDVPDLDNTIRVNGANVLATDRERTVIDGV